MSFPRKPRSLTSPHHKSAHNDRMQTNRETPSYAKRAAAAEKHERLVIWMADVNQSLDLIATPFMDSNSWARKRITRFCCIVNLERRRARIGGCKSVRLRERRAWEWEPLLLRPILKWARRGGRGVEWCAGVATARDGDTLATEPPVSSRPALII